MATTRQEAIDKFEEYIKKHVPGKANQEFWLRQLEKGVIYPKATQERAGSPPKNYRMVSLKRTPSNSRVKTLLNNYENTSLKNASANNAAENENENVACSTSGCLQRLRKHGKNRRWWGGRTRRNKKRQS
jgi:hypothetical protein